AKTIDQKTNGAGQADHHADGGGGAHRAVDRITEGGQQRYAQRAAADPHESGETAHQGADDLLERGRRQGVGQRQTLAAERHVGGYQQSDHGEDRGQSGATQIAADGDADQYAYQQGGPPGT